MIDTRSTEVRLRWRASPLTSAVATSAAVALAAAVISASWQLIAFAAPLLGVLCSIAWQRPAPTVVVYGKPALVRCFEADDSEATVWATADSPDAGVLLTVSAVAGMRMQVRGDETRQPTTITAAAERWGRYPVRARVDVSARGGLLAGAATVDAVEIFVFPVAPPQSTEVPLAELADQLGVHLTRRWGPGVEYADIRSYLPGDQLRSVNWAVSARRGSLHVTERLTDRAADVVALVDDSDQPPGPATAATERMARGATQIVQTALRNGDRCGVVTLGGARPRWLGADIGRRQFYRVLDALLAAGTEFEDTAGTLAPRAAVPPRAIVVAFSTMLDTDFSLALIDLYRRGHAVVAVDVLEGDPFAEEQDPVLTRMWGLQRAGMYRDMRAVGVDVVPWPRDATLDQALRHVPVSNVTAARRR